jgi:Holliday junction DNA helicase RuvA
LIASLSGRIEEIASGSIVVDVRGVGYRVHSPASLLSRMRAGKQIKLLTHMVVREDSMTLYGFAEARQLEDFQLLLGVTGVGPKLALGLLSAFGPDELRRLVASGDADALTEVPGLGKRGAERVIVELKGKFSAGFSAPAGTKAAEVREALVALGYTPVELRGVMERVVEDDAPVEEMVRAVLRELAVK